MSRASWLILGLAVLAAAAGGWLQHASRQSRAGTAVAGRPGPDLRLRDLDGRPHRIADYRGRRVLLNLWASWCTPCLKEMPALARAQAKFGERGAIVVGIAMDEPDRVRAFLARHPVNYPILLGAPDTSRQLGNEPELLPYSVLLDAQGRILATRRGMLDDALLDRWLAAPDGG
ncbi:TlpA disulfide reductase family protein [Frateuria sp. Soil773]|uniref:TlpA family protein disulfide reductase n=1 Tax=Frateuria sp. Soil773 TaxID=1736407 RepID=UPI002E167402